ncbi:MAG: copper amine oxidase N-terminal domain-containing protein [Bacillota bacterium]
MAFILKYRNKFCYLLYLVLLAAVLSFMVGVPAALSDEAGIEGDSSGEEVTEEDISNRPLTVIVDNIEKTSDVPLIHKGGRIYVPVRFLSESLGYPVEYVEGQRTVYVGVRPMGTDLVDQLKAFTGIKIKQMVKISGIGYTKGYALSMGAFSDVRWKLDARFKSVTINLGIPDNLPEDTAEFTVTADDRIIAKVKLSKDSGLKEFNYNVKGVNVLTVSCSSGKGGALICPRAH